MADHPVSTPAPRTRLHRLTRFADGLGARYRWRGALGGEAGAASMQVARRPGPTIDTRAEPIASTDGLHATLEAEQVALLYRSPTLLLTNLVVGLLAAAGLSPAFPQHVRLGWLGVMGAVVAARLALWAWHRAARGGPVGAAARWATRFTVGSFATGCVWGMLAWVVYAAPEPRFAVFAAFAVGGVSAGAVLGTACYMPALIAFVAPAVLPIAAAFAMQGDTVSSEMAAMVAAFAAVLLMVGRSLNRWIGDNVRLNFERGGLVADLKQSAQGLQREIAERRVREIELEKVTGSLGERARSLRLLNDLVERLQEALSAQEFSEIVEGFAPQILGGTPGALFLMNNSENLLTQAAEWNGPTLPAPTFHPEDCWALRRSQLHAVTPGRWEVRCRHVHCDHADNYTCIPLLGRGSIVGVLYLERGVALRTGSSGTLQLDDDTTAFANTLGLALANYRLRERLRIMSLRDALTSLYNRRYFEEAIEIELARAARSDGKVGIILGDVDHFKAINDKFGHDSGDAALRAVGQALAKAVRPGDIACRYGGEEFVILLPGTTFEEARARAEELRNAVCHISVASHGQMIGPITMSFGVTIVPDLADTSQSAVAGADRAMYLAKQQGRNRVVMADRPEANGAVAAAHASAAAA